MIILMWNYWVGLAHVVLMCFDVVCDPPLILFCFLFVWFFFVLLSLPNWRFIREQPRGASP